jgi:hypothetical protein
MQAITPPRRAELTVPDHDEAMAVDAGASRPTIRGRPHPGRTRHAAHGRRGTLKHLVQVRKRSV